MAEIVSLFTETPEAFVRRNGPTLTQEIGYRFNWDVPTARKIMQRLEARGLVKSKLVTHCYGQSLEWTATE